jgi:hypothetical protein
MHNIWPKSRKDAEQVYRPDQVVHPAARTGYLDRYAVLAERLARGSQSLGTAHRGLEPAAIGMDGQSHQDALRTAHI